MTSCHSVPSARAKRPLPSSPLIWMDVVHWEVEKSLRSPQRLHRLPEHPTWLEMVKSETPDECGRQVLYWIRVLDVFKVPLRG